MQERANAFDKAGLTKREVDKALVALKEFRQKFPFVENLREIEWLNPDRLFRVNPDMVGEFFLSLENIFKPLGYPAFGNSNVYRNARLQINDFKLLLRTTADDRKPLAQKVDAKWERIGGIGEDKALALEIIYSFNYEGKTVLPIFSIQHMRHFANRIVDESSGPTKYFSLGQEYEHYTAELLKAKNNLPVTRGWDNLYFARFLYASYPPPDSEASTQTGTGGERKLVNQVTDEQLDMQGFVKLLGELQRQHKITGEEFRENRATWMQLKPNDREVLVIRLKQRLNSENKTDEAPKSQPPPKRRL
ncbi:MAG: hypothetical protein ACFCUE_07830 [Candidatus Bathyarchaeia archaeon]|jgi:hypothetical protein